MYLLVHVFHIILLRKREDWVRLRLASNTERESNVCGDSSSRVTRQRDDHEKLPFLKQGVWKD